MEASDSELLEKFARESSEEAFAALVRRYLNLVYSAALRQVHSPQLAEEVAQSVFLDLARSASKLKTDSLLSAWLFQTTRRTAINTWRQESRRQLREQISVELADMNASESEWPQIEPLLDEAMDRLTEKDRDALLLRFFEGKSLREIGVKLGMSEDAAQKRVSRAVDQLREFFVERGVTVGAASVAVLLSANAVQAAPVALFGAISSAAISGAAVSQVGLAVKTLIMTTTQKILITAVASVAVATGVYQAVQISELRASLQQRDKQQEAMIAQAQRLGREREQTIAQLAAVQKQLDVFQREAATVPKLRGTVSRLEGLAQKPAAGTNNALLRMMNDPKFGSMMASQMKSGMMTLYAPLIKEFQLTPEEEQRFIDLLGNDFGKNMELVMKVLQGGDKEALEKEKAAEKEKTQDEVKTLLGEERFAKYKEFAENIPRKAVVDGFSQKLRGENALSTEQSQQLLQIVIEEAKLTRAAVPAGLPEEDIEVQIERQRQLNESILKRSSNILTAAQFAAFTKYQADRLETTRSGLMMSQSLRGAFSSGGGK